MHNSADIANATADPKHVLGGVRGLSVVIPVLNEERGIGALLARLTPVLDATGERWDILFVDDGSTDGTLLALRAANARDPRVKAISLSRNFGKEIAVAAGLRHATGAAVVLMDGDLQHPPEVIPEFVAKWRAGYDDVYAQRQDRAADSPSRRLLSVFYYRTFKVLSGTKLHENAGDFRLLSRRAVDALNQLGERARFNKGLFAWIGFKSTGVPFDVPDRQDAGGSRWNMRKLVRFAFDGIASFTTLPLRIWSVIGLAVSLFAFTYIVVFVIKTLIFGAELKGFPTLIVSIMFFSGIQLISLGVIGEYLGRIYEEVKARPLFLVAEEIGLGGDGGTRPGTAVSPGQETPADG
ncbi:MAG: glycosyltransferase [Hyphomicrobium sp.]|nr:glycosyltransferase [Hyphomicrobium sp.]PPC81396.1 MAG: glycosyltransferase [Hyphomicrobium sp.]